MAALEEQIASYRRLLPTLRIDHGSAWVVFVDCCFAGAFATFEEAARFARRAYPQDDWLIRHTDEVPATIPFLTVDT